MKEKGRLGEILIAAGEITPEQLEAGLAEQRESGRPLGMTLVRMGVLDEDTLIRRLSKQLSLPMARLRGKRVNPQVIALVPAELAEKHHCFPLFVKEEAEGKVLYLGMEDATNLDAMDDVATRIGMQVRPVLVATSEIDEAQHRHYADPLVEAPPPEPLPLGDADGDSSALPPPAAIDDDSSAGDLDFDSGPDLGPEPDLEVDAALDLGDADAPDAALALGEPDAPDGAFDLGEPDAPDGAFDLDTGPDLDLSVPEPAEAQAPAPPAPAPESVSPDAILRALSQLLVEKGVITREELIDRVHRESAEDLSRRRS